MTNTLRLLEASAAVKQAVVDGKISEGHARALLALSSAKAQEIALHRVINLDLSVRQTELLARKLSGKKPVPKKKTRRSADAADIEKRLRASLGTKVALKHGKKRRHTHALLLLERGTRCAPGATAVAGRDHAGVVRRKALAAE